MCFWFLYQAVESTERFQKVLVFGCLLKTIISSANRSFGVPVTVFVPNEGRIERTFRNKGDAVAYLNKKYGHTWKKMRLRFENGLNLKSYDGFLCENH